MREFGKLGQVSALTLGGGGIGQVWGPTTRAEAVATVLEAIEGGITLLDDAPSYGNGEVEVVIGEAYNGRLPDGVRISTKCNVGDAEPRSVARMLDLSLTESLERMKLDSVDLFFLHNQIIPNGVGEGYRGSPRVLFTEVIRPSLERMQRGGRIRAWGITGIGVPEQVIHSLCEYPPPGAVQAITNLLDSPGGLKRYPEAPRPRDVIATAVERGVGVMGIRAVQAGALTDAIDRELPDDHLDLADYHRAAPFRALARELGAPPAALAHRYALSMEGVSTVVLGVKNREELRECLAAEERGPLDSETMARIDAAVAGT